MEIERARKESARERERERWGMNAAEKQTRDKKKNEGCHEIRLLKCFKHAAY